MSENQNTFHYTYSASQQEEVRRIRDKYIPKEEDKMERLRRMDQAAARPGAVAALFAGVIGTLMLGIGMCFSMVWADALFVPGVVVGLIGIGLDMAAYPLYSHITKRRRRKLAPEILRLTEELMQ